MRGLWWCIIYGHQVINFNPADQKPQHKTGKRECVRNTRSPVKCVDCRAQHEFTHTHTPTHSKRSASRFDEQKCVTCKRIKSTRSHFFGPINKVSTPFLMHRRRTHIVIVRLFFSMLMMDDPPTRPVRPVRILIFTKNGSTVHGIDLICVRVMS